MATVEVDACADWARLASAGGGAEILVWDGGYVTEIQDMRS